MSVNRGIDLQVILRIKVHRDPRESSAGQKLRQLLGCRRGRSFWIHVDHLSRAIDDHSELGHLMRPEQAIEMWPGVHIKLALVSDPDWNVCKCAITHSQCRQFADAIMPGVAYDAYDAWLGGGGYDDFIVYRAAADREEAAAAALAAGSDSIA